MHWAWICSGISLRPRRKSNCSWIAWNRSWAAESVVAVAAQERFQAIQEQFDFLLGRRLIPEQIHAQCIDPGAELLVHDRGQHDRAQVRELAPHDGKHLQA